MKKMIFKRTLSLILLICMALTSEPARLLAEELSNDAGQQEETRQMEVGDYRISISRDESGEETAVIDKYLGNEANVTVPDIIGGYLVTGIGDGAFSGCTFLTEIVIPDSVTSIGRHTFSSCWYLTDITIPLSVTSIGAGAFSSCEYLTGIAIPNGVTVIGEGTFSGCVSLTDIEIPNSVTSIGDNAFSGCALKEIAIPNSVTSIGNGAFSSCGALTNITIPDSVTSIGDNAFSGCALKEIAIPNSVTSIGKGIFSNCRALTDITIPDSVTSIGESAFSGCTSLTEIVIPNSVTSIGNSAFSGCTSLTKAIIPDNVTSIKESLFESCPSLKEVTIPDSVTLIEGSAFLGCKSLTEVTIPDGVTSIGGRAFSCCESLTEVVIPNSVTWIDICTFSSCTSLKKVIIPDSVISIRNSAFSDCASLTEVTIPDSVTSMGESVFYSCTSLNEIAIPNGVTSIGRLAFSGCTSLTEVTIPDSVTSMGESVFSGCTSLKEIAIPDKVASIGTNAFSGSGLTNVTIPTGMTSIEDYVFSGCSALANVTISDNVTSIGNSAFSDCTSLTEIMIPDSIESIGGSTFNGCPELVLSVVPGSYAEQYAIEHEISFKYFVDDSVASVRVTLSPDENLDLQGLLLTIKNNDYQTSRRLTYDMQCRFGGVLIGDGYTVEVSNDYGDIFSKLENVSVQAGINQLELTEFAVPTIVNARVLSDDGEDVTDRCVIEWLDGEGNDYASGASLRMVPAGKQLVCRVRLDEYLSAMYEIPEDTAWTASVSDSDLEIRLNPLQAEGAVLGILAEYTARTDDGDAPEPKLAESLSGMSFSIVNETSGIAVSRYIIQDSSLILPENVNAGDTVTITVSSRAKDFAQASRTVVMESDNHANAEFSLTQFGALKASYQNGKNSSVRLLIYDENGSLAWTGASQKSEDLQSNSLPDGNYTALVMGNSKFMAYPDTLQGISDFGLEEGNDYIARSVTIRTGKNTVSSFGEIPVFDEERFMSATRNRRNFH